MALRLDRYSVRTIKGRPTFPSEFCAVVRKGEIVRRFGGSSVSRQTSVEACMFHTPQWHPVAMEFIRLRSRDGLLRPALSLALTRVAGDGFSLPKDGIANALDPYDRTFDATLASMDKCLDTLSDVFSEPIGDDGMLKAHTEGFQDAMYRLHTAYLTHLEILHKLASEVLRQGGAGEPSALSSLFTPLRRPIARRLNQLKHSGSHYVLALKFKAEQRVPGYAVFSSLPKRSTGPDPKAHPNGMAVSLLREMRVMLLAMYWLSGHVLELAHGVLPSGTGPAAEKVAGDDPLIHLVERLQALPSLVYASEAGLAVPTATLQRKDDTTKLVLRNVCTLTPGVTFKWPSLVRVQAYGSTKTFTYGIFGDTNVSIGDFRATINMRGRPPDEVAFA